MNKLHRRGSFANSRGHTLHRAVTHVARSEYSGLTRLEPERITLKRPVTRQVTVSIQSREVGAGKDEPVIVSFDYLRQPLRMRQCADENEQGIRGQCFFLSTHRVEYRDCFKSVVAVHFDNGSSQTNLDVFGRL